MPYYKNDHSVSGSVSHGHEDAVAVRLTDASFTEEDKTKYPLLSKSLLKAWVETGDDTELRNATKGMPVGTFIKQPAGSQGLPDILVKDFDNTYIAIECKSTGRKVNTPMWNDNVPKQDIIYVISSAKYDATTIFLGKDVISNATYELLAKQEAEIELIVQKYKKLMSTVDTFNRGWQQRSRKQHTQAGKSVKTNYFVHPDRIKCEKNALKFVLGK